MAQAIEAGIPKLRIEEAAARTQARIDSGRQPVIGVNKYRADADEPIEVLKVDNTLGARPSSSRSCAGCAPSATRPPAEAALRALTARRRPDGRRAALDGNLLALAVDAARAKATVGEISDALEKVYGRHAGADPYDLRRVPRRGRDRPRASSETRAAGRGVRARPRAAGRGSWSPRWARTATTAARR